MLQHWWGLSITSIWWVPVGFGMGRRILTSMIFGSPALRNNESGFIFHVGFFFRLDGARLPFQRCGANTTILSIQPSHCLTLEMPWKKKSSKVGSDQLLPRHQGTSCNDIFRILQLMAQWMLFCDGNPSENGIQCLLGWLWTFIVYLAYQPSLSS